MLGDWCIHAYSLLLNLSHRSILGHPVSFREQSSAQCHYARCILWGWRAQLLEWLECSRQCHQILIMWPDPFILLLGQEWLKIAADEAKHYTTWANRLAELSSYYGAIPVHNGKFFFPSFQIHCVVASVILISLSHIQVSGKVLERHHMICVQDWRLSTWYMKPEDWMSHHKQLHDFELLVMIRVQSCSKRFIWTRWCEHWLIFELEFCFVLFCSVCLVTWFLTNTSCFRLHTWQPEFDGLNIFVNIPNHSLIQSHIFIRLFANTFEVRSRSPLTWKQGHKPGSRKVVISSALHSNLVHSTHCWQNLDWYVPLITKDARQKSKSDPEQHDFEH